MTTEFPKPRVFISKCLGFAKCRWNGDMIPDSFVAKLKPFVSHFTTCPECEIGLGVPRDPIRIVLQKGVCRLMQLHTGCDVTETMDAFTGQYLRSLTDMDGFILKDRSPSCGIKEVKVYPGLEPAASLKKSAGFFGAAVLEHFPEAAVESEARLSNRELREHFLTRIFTFSRFRAAAADLRMRRLIQFHAENKLLLMLYNQKEMRIMGQIAANPSQRPPAEIFREYREALGRALARKPSFTSAINVLMHGLGYFSKRLKPGERTFFLNTLEEYRREQVPLSVPVNVLRSYAIRFEEEYIGQQTFLRPYPDALLEIRDTGR